MYPSFDELDFTRYELFGGFHSLGFIKYHRPDIHLIDLDEVCGLNHLRPTDPRVLRALEQEIEHNLSKGLNVCLVICDEITLPIQPELSALVNRYKNDRFWFFTILAPQQQKIYTFQGGVECKILEIPWIMLNDVLCYYHVCKSLPRRSPDVTSHQYLCMANRHDIHKQDLLCALRDNHLDSYGLITVTGSNAWPDDVRSFAQSNSIPFYQQRTRYPWNAAQVEMSGLWVSANVENYMHIESTYDMPLMINPETTTGIFHSSEKSFWPALLGRLYLIYGQPWSMSLVQRFHDVEQSSWADISFDEMEGDWSLAANRDRLAAMIERNRYLITHARDIYADLKDQLENARWTLGRNLYHFTLDRLRTIPVSLGLVDQ